MRHWGLILFFLSWNQPLHVMPWSGWHSEVLAFLALIIIFLDLQLNNWKFKKHEYRIGYVGIVPLILFVIVCAQFAIGKIQYLGDALIISMYLIGACIAGIVGAELSRHYAEHKVLDSKNHFLLNFAKVVVISAVVSVGIALIQTFELLDSAELINRTGGWRRTGGNFGQANHQATLLLMGLVSLVLLFEVQQLQSASATTLGVYLLLGVAMAESRTALIGAICITLWWYAKHHANASRISFLAIAIAWLFLIGFVVTWPILITNVYFPSETNLGVVPPVNLAAGARWVVWPQLLQAAMLHPWVGWGLGELSHAHNSVLHLYSMSEPFSYAHNLVLDLTLGLGFPVAIVVTLLGVYWIQRRMRGASTLRAWYGIAVCMPIAIHSQLEFPFAYAYFLFPFMMIVGVMDADLTRRARMFQLPTRIVGIVVLLWVGVCAWSMVEYMKVEEDFRVARFEALKVGQTDPLYVRPHIVLLTQMQAMLDATRTLPKPGMSATELNALRSAAMRFPWVAIQNRYALALALNGQQEESLRQLMVMRAMHGEKLYKRIIESWQFLSDTQFPLLKSMKFQ